MLQHGSCAARDGEGVLILGPPGAGKSDLLLRLLGEGWRLVADDQVSIESGADGLSASAPDALRGMVEVRGIGLLEGFEVEPRAALRLAVRTVKRAEVPRLPHPARIGFLGTELPLVALCPHEASAPAKLDAALRAATGRLLCRAGAFEAA